jgi:hypothetical protein
MFELFDNPLTITSVVVIPDSYKIRAVFSNGENGTADFKADIDSKTSLCALKDPAFFVKCAIIDEGTAIGWPGDITMGWDTIYMSAKEQGSLMSGDTMTAEDFKSWLKSTGLNQTEVADKFNYSTRQISKFATGKAEIPPVVRLACLAIQAGLDQQSHRL